MTEQELINKWGVDYDPCCVETIEEVEKTNWDTI